MNKQTLLKVIEENKNDTSFGHEFVELLTILTEEPNNVNIILTSYKFGQGTSALSSAFQTVYPGLSNEGAHLLTDKTQQ